VQRLESGEFQQGCIPRRVKQYIQVDFVELDMNTIGKVRIAIRCEAERHKEREKRKGETKGGVSCMAVW